jgi:hypothetical protein
MKTNCSTFPAFVGLCLVLGGCFKSPSDRPGTVSPQINRLLTFTDSEIKTKSWKDRDGDVVLLDFSVMKLTNRADLALAKYGIADTRVTNCLDFYVSYPTPLNEPPFFLSVAHDYQPGNVVSVSTVAEKGRVFIKVRRELASLNGSKAGSTTYY